ncbi:MAG: hypothetical protein WCT20_00200 [Candidatus Babeliales bacterium]
MIEGSGMRTNDFLKMEVEGVDNFERMHMQQGITWPALMALNSSFKLENTRFRLILLNRLKTICDEKGMMVFFVNPYLQRKYPPDLESTALFVAGCVLNDQEIVTDLDDIKKRIMPNGFFETWIGRNDYPIDYTSQLMMSICYGSAGLDVSQILENIIKDKFKDFISLSARDTYYMNPLYFIYFTLYIKDRGVLSNNHQQLVERFVETYIPADEIEVAMIKKICIKYSLVQPKTLIEYRENPIISHGRRTHITYDSTAVKEVFRSSADLRRRKRFNRAML